MAKVHLLSQCFDQAGAERLATVLEQVLTANADPGPRWPQIRLLGGSLRHMSRDLEKGIGCLAVAPDSAALEFKALRDHLYRLADAFSRIGSLAERYPA